MNRSISDRMIEIRRRLKEDITDEERKALMREKFNTMTLNKGGVVYRAEGGTTWGEDAKAVGKEALPGFVQDKLREALGAGVNPNDIQRTLKNNALKSRNARVRGALLKGGLTSLGKSNENQAGLITQAGINNSSFTPQSTLGGVGQSLTEAGAAEGKYHDELTRQQEVQDKASIEAEKRRKKATKEGDSKTYRQIQEALLLVDAASSAGDIVNGYKVVQLSEEDQKKLDESKSWLDKGVDFLGQGASTVAGAFSAGNRIRKEVLSKVAKEQVPESFNAFVRLERLATAMAQTVLAQQTGTKTDFDFEVASKTLFNIERQSETWKPQLTDALNEMYSQSASKEPLDKINVEFQSRVPVAANDTATAEAPASVDPVVNEEVIVDDTTEVNTTGNVDDAAETTLKYTKDKPLVVPDAAAKGLGNKWKTTAWLLTQGLDDGDYISYNGQVVTYADYKES